MLVLSLFGSLNLPGDIAKNFFGTKLIDKPRRQFGRKLHEVPIGFQILGEIMLEQNILIGRERRRRPSSAPLVLPESRTPPFSALFRDH